MLLLEFEPSSLSFDIRLYHELIRCIALGYGAFVRVFKYWSEWLFRLDLGFTELGGRNLQDTMLLAIFRWVMVFRDLTISIKNSLHKLLLKGVLRLKSLNSLVKLLIVTKLLEWVVPVWRVLLPAVAEVVFALLLGHQRLLVGRQEACEEVAQTYWIRDDPPDVQLRLIVLSHELQMAYPFMLV